VTLGVDAENGTGAMRPYARAGRYFERKNVAPEKELG
jgi:hypothetical protein